MNNWTLYTVYTAQAFHLLFVPKIKFGTVDVSAKPLSPFHNKKKNRFSSLFAPFSLFPISFGYGIWTARYQSDSKCGRSKLFLFRFHHCGGGNFPPWDRCVCVCGSSISFSSKGPLLPGENEKEVKQQMCRGKLPWKASLVVVASIYHESITTDVTTSMLTLFKKSQKQKLSQFWGFLSPTAG